MTANLDKRGVVHHPCWCQKTKVIALLCGIKWYKNICGALFGFVTKHACDRQRGGQIDRTTTANTVLACIACIMQ